MKDNKKSTNQRATLIRLWRYLFEYKLILFVVLILTVVSNLLVLVGPMLTGYAIDAIELGTGQVDFKTVTYYSVLMLIFFIGSSILSYLLAMLMIHLSQKVIFKMRKDLFNKMADLPIGYFDRYQTGDLISRITYDIDTINASLSNDLIQILTSMITVVGSLIMMFIISPILVLVLVVTIPASIFYTKYMTGKIKPLFRKRSTKLGELNGFVEEIISGQKTVKAYHQEAIMLQRFDEKNDEAVEAYYQSEYYGSTVGPAVNFINNLSMSLIGVFGTLLFLYGQLSIGSVSSFILYSRKFSGPINEMANIISELQSAIAAAERVFRLMDEEPEGVGEPNEDLFTDVRGDVELENIDFGYEKDKIILHNLSLKAAQGHLVAIVGPTGAGKTTLINLLMRFYDPSGGRITLDGVPVKDSSRKSLRATYAMVLQDTWLFTGTIFDYIAYAKKGATMEEVIEAAKAAKIHTTIMQLPKGYHTLLNEEGMNISQGQKQLLTIARAMLIDAKMLILDEATSNVDTQTELQIQGAMRKLMKDKTCFVIAHRLSTIQSADTILVVKDGNIIEQGDHQTLLNQKGLYSELYYAQFEQ